MGPQIDPAYFIAEHLNSLYRFLQNYLDFIMHPMFGLNSQFLDEILQFVRKYGS